MSIKKDIYLERNNPTHKILILVSEYFKDEIVLNFIEDIPSSSTKEILKFSPTKIFPLLKEGDFFLSGTIPILKYILNLNLEVKEVLMGKNLSLCFINAFHFLEENLFDFGNVVSDVLNLAKKELISLYLM